MVQKLVAQWYPFPFFGVQGSLIQQPTQKGVPLLQYGCWATKEVHLPLEDNMSVEDLRKSIAGRIGLRLGGMLVLTAGGNALDDSKPLWDQVQGDVITYVVQQVALASLISFPSLLGARILFWCCCRRCEKRT